MSKSEKSTANNSGAIKEIINNRRAGFEYEILETFEAGIILLGTEIKSLRDNGGSLQEAYIVVEKDGLWLLHASIPPYRHGNIFNHEERRKRKLLMHKRETERLGSAKQEKGLTIIPLSLYLKNGLAKLKIALAKGKKIHDKRASIQERDDKRALQRALKHNH